ncbi:MAG TPA: TadE family protein [Acidimicrobiales bacterium]|nr:TadE family protein [Acidimicrobiales bacterium]
MSGFRSSGHTRSERGSALVEFSVVFGLFAFIIFALVTFGMMLAAKNSITHAAAEGARAAIGVAELPAATLDSRREDEAKAAVARSLDWFGSKYQPSDTSAAVARCDPANVADLTECITVTITYPYKDRPIIPPLPGIGLMTPDTFTATAVVKLS